MKYKMTISYDGTRYGGWQVQPNALSIQALIQDGLEILLHQFTPLTSSGRTDAGVHAHGQVAHFLTSKTLISHIFLNSLNEILPKDIRILSICPVFETFHARFSCKKKIYHYHLHLSPVQSPFHFLYATHIPTSINLNLMRRALSAFLGTHDFSSFSGAGCGSKNPNKTIYRLDMIPEPEGIRLEFEGDGFLYKMIRNIVGTLLQISKYKITIRSIAQIFAKRDRRLAGPTAPAKGLVLHRVLY